MIGHGAIVILIALAAGIGLGMSLIGGWEVFPGRIVGFEIPGDTRAWARAHAGGLMNGLLVIAGALLIHALNFAEPLARRVYWMLVGTGYANTIFYWGALLSANRALTFGDNRLGEASLASVIGFLPAFVFAFVTMIAMVLIAREAFRRDA
jgi:hypothetical protein